MYTEHDLKADIQQYITRGEHGLTTVRALEGVSICQLYYYVTSRALLPSATLYDDERAALDDVYGRYKLMKVKGTEVFVMHFFLYYFMRHVFQAVLPSHSERIFNGLLLSKLPDTYPGADAMAKWLRPLFERINSVAEDQLADSFEILLSPGDKGRAEMLSKKLEKVAERLLSLRYLIRLSEMDKYEEMGTCFALLHYKYTPVTNAAQLCLIDMCRSYDPVSSLKGKP